MPLNNLFLSFILAALLPITFSCVPLIGIDDSTPGSINSSSLVDFPEDGIYLAIFKALISNGGTPLLAYETPIALRIPTFTQSSIYNVLATFEPRALDIYAREDVSNRRRRCAPADDDIAGKKLFSLHRRISFAYAWATTAVAFLPEAEPLLYPVLRNWGLDPFICEGVKITCDESTPYGLAHVVKLEALDYARRDGWNDDGSLSRTFNKIPYEDSRDRPYVPRNNPWVLQFPRFWQPLKEHDGRGFMFHQEHVVPHIGDMAKSRLFSNKEVCARQLSRPRYNYQLEVKKLLRRSRKLTVRKKVAITLFDTKPFSLVPLVSQFFKKQGKSRDDFDVRWKTTAFHLALYEAILFSWKEKVKHDLVRPPSIVKHLLGSQKVRVYAGPGQGVQILPADEWMPYIRTMPHAEFPSASACMCQAFADVMREISGVKNFAKVINGSLEITMAKGASKIENGFPRKDVVLRYRTWDAIIKECGRSRVDGGMHFSASVTQGRKLCRTIGKRAAEFMKRLSIGKRPVFVTPFEGRAPRVARC